jgi:general secretion pathway protein J
MKRKPLVQQSPRGFTLIEMLVALAVMALLAVMSWRGLDAMLRARQVIDDNHAALQSLQGGLSQWQIDLDALVETPYVNAVDWDGRALRVLRRSPVGNPESLQVVAWALSTAGDRASWMRWQSQPLQSRADLLAAWADAAAWGGNADAGERVVAIAPVQAWQLTCFRGGQWVAADSLLRAGGGGRPSLGDLPEGLQLQLVLPEAGPLQGPLRSDWFNPLAGAAR